MESTLVLGGSGFLGAHVLVAARAGGAETVSASRRPERGPAGTGWADDVSRATVELSDLDSLRVRLDELAPARVIFVAALSRVRECDADPELALRVNAHAPAFAASWCARTGARMVHVSTDLVFGRAVPSPRGFDESAEPAPASVYGRSKREGERAVLAANERALVVRLPLLFGPSGGRGLGASDSLLAGLANRDASGLFTDEWRTPLHAADAARALCELAAGDEIGLLHVAGPERVNRYELGLVIAQAAGADGEPTPTTREALGMGDRPCDVSLDATRARSILRTPLHGLAEGIALG